MSTIFFDGTEETVISGIDFSEVVAPDDTDFVLSVVDSGAVVSAIVESGGYVVVGNELDEGGSTFSVLVQSGGEMLVRAGGLAVSTLLDGGTLSGLPGITEIGTHGGGEQIVTSGGHTISTIVDVAGKQLVFGGTSLDTFVNAGGEQKVFQNFALGSAFDQPLADNVNEGSSLAIHTTLSGAVGFPALQIVSGNDTDDGFGKASVLSTVVLDGGLQEIESGGVTVSATLSAASLVDPAFQAVYSGGSSLKTTVNANGVMDLGGALSPDPTDFEKLYSIFEHTELPAGDSEFSEPVDVTTAGVVTSEFSVTQSQGGVSGSAFASGTVVNNSGFEFVDDFSFDLSATINAGGEQLIFNDALAGNATLNGGDQFVEGLFTHFDAGFASGTVINDGGFQAVFGVASATKVNNGNMTVWSGGFEAHATINGPNAFATIVGSAFGDKINGGTEFVVSHGFVGSATVNGSGSAPGNLVVSSGSEASATTINAGGNELIFFSGLDVSATVNGGGAQIVLAGGEALDAEIEQGGQQIVEAGGTASNTLIEGGFMDLQAGGSALFVSFSADSGGVLQIDSPTTDVPNAIAGFASPPGVTENIDLEGFSFSGATETFTQNAPTSGTLHLTNSAGQTVNLTLLGQYATSNFTLSSSDGGADTLIVDPATSASATLTTPHA